MKKHFVTVAALALLIVLAGCAENNKPYDDTESPSRPESSVSRQSPVLPDTDGTSSFLASEESKAPAVSESPESKLPPASSQSPKETQRPTEKPTPEKEKQPAGQEPSQPVTPQPEKPPVSKPQQPPAPTTPSESPASESEAPPTPTGPEAPAFDVSAYVQFAKDYGTSDKVGLRLDSTATARWDDPLTANAGCRYLERDLRDRLDWYKASGFTAFWVWAEQTGNGEYLIYISYA